MKKIREIYKIADKNNIDVLESLNNYFTLTAQNDVFDNIKHLSQDLLNGIHDPDAVLE